MEVLRNKPKHNNNNNNNNNKRRLIKWGFFDLSQNIIHRVYDANYYYNYYIAIIVTIDVHRKILWANPIFNNTETDPNDIKIGRTERWSWNDYGGKCVRNVFFFFA